MARIYDIGGIRRKYEIDEKYDILGKYCISPIYEKTDNIVQEQRPASKRVLVLDLDGTLTTDEKLVLPQTRLALENLMDRGVIIVLASGRPLYGILPLARDLGLMQRGGFILAFNGGLVLDCLSGRVLFSQSLDRAVLPDVLDFALSRGLCALSYRDELILSSEGLENRFVSEEARINGMEVRCVGADLLSELPDIVVKLLVVGDPELISAALVDFRSVFSSRGLDAFTSAPFFMEVVPAGIDKGACLLRLLDILHLDADEMVCIGDGGNDVGMLRVAGVGVAMCNAPAFVRDSAHWVTSRDNNNDGVGEAIARFFPQ